MIPICGFSDNQSDCLQQDTQSATLIAIWKGGRGKQKKLLQIFRDRTQSKHKYNPRHLQGELHRLHVSCVISMWSLLQLLSICKKALQWCLLYLQVLIDPFQWFAILAWHDFSFTQLINNSIVKCSSDSNQIFQNCTRQST